MQRLDLAGRTFGRLAVLEMTGVGPRGYTQWLCACECGGRAVVAGTLLRSGGVRSCGCIRRQRAITRNRKHDGCGTAEYRAWNGMKNRCRNPRLRSWKRYGGRGITVCDRWLHSFETFLADMGPRPSPEHSIDRFPDNDGDYEPGNCRWATPTEQQRNRSTTRNVTLHGITQCVAAWEEQAGVRTDTFHRRLQRGIPPIAAFVEWSPWGEPFPADAAA